MRTLKEQCLYLHRFQTLDEARRVIAAFIGRYNHEWLIERLDYRTPAQARAQGWRARRDEESYVRRRGLRV